MDTEEGVEVVWNEVQFSDKKVFKSFEVGVDHACFPTSVFWEGYLACYTTNICEMLLYWSVIILEWWYGDRQNA